jgi:hypothetical protein
MKPKDERFGAVRPPGAVSYRTGPSEERKRSAFSR